MEVFHGDFWPYENAKEEDWVRPYLGIATEEVVGDGDADVEGKRLHDAGLHAEYLLPVVRAVTNVKEVAHEWLLALLQKTRLSPAGS